MSRISALSGWVVASLAMIAATMFGSALALAQEKPIESTPAVRTPLTLTNPGFEEGQDGWLVSEPSGKAYEFAVDSAIYHGGKQAIHIRSVGGDHGAAVYQVLPAAMLRGRTVELSGWLKTDSVDDGAVLTLRALGNSRILEYNLMRSSPVKGTTEWKKYAIPLKVSKNASDLEIGFMLNSKGTMWADDFELNIISHQ